eukprot:2437573-Pyramimonas_sp.AAC.1
MGRRLEDIRWLHGLTLENETPEDGSPMEWIRIARETPKAFLSRVKTAAQRELNYCEDKQELKLFRKELEDISRGTVLQKTNVHHDNGKQYYGCYDCGFFTEHLAAYRGHVAKQHRAMHVQD